MSKEIMIISAILYLIYALYIIPSLTCWLLYLIVSKIQSSKIYSIVAFIVVLICIVLGTLPAAIFILNT